MKASTAIVAPTGLIRVSQTAVNEWRKCRKAYTYRFVQGLRRRKAVRPLKFGSIVHEMIEAHANSDDPFEVLDAIGLKDMKLFRAEREEYGDIIEDIRVIMSEYFAHYPDNSLIYVRSKGKGAEHKFELPDLVPGVVITGKIDGFARTPNKLKWLVEHKSFGKALPNEDHRWRNVQSSIYLRITDMLGWHNDIEGMCWDYIRSKPPSAPEVLQSGKLSERKIDSLPSKVIAAIKEAKKNPKDFPELIAAAEENRERYFQRIFTPRKDDVVDSMFGDFLKSATEIAELHGKSDVRNIARHCEWCQFEMLCRAELTGSDVDYLIDREYYTHGEENNGEEDRESTTTE